MGWTRARLLAYKNEWYDASLDHEGPACYEIGTGGPRGGNIEWHYVGETVNEKARMSRYGSDGSHLSKMINWHLEAGVAYLLPRLRMPIERGRKADAGQPPRPLGI